MRAEVFCFGRRFLRLRVIARLVEHLGQRNRGERDAGLFFEQGSASTADENGFENTDQC